MRKNILLVLFCMWMILGFIGGWAVFSEVTDRSPPIEYIGAQALEASAAQGGTIDIRFDVRRQRICPVVKASRILTDSAGEEHAISNYTLATNTRPGRESYDRTIQVPETAAIGPATYQITVTYACNVVHQLGWPIVVYSPPVPFLVTEAPPTLVLPLPEQHD